MTNAAGDGGGRTGPYWRRQLGITLPGERTGQQLNLINQLRRKAGLPPIGGPVGDNTRVARPGGRGRGGFNPIDLPAHAGQGYHPHEPGGDTMDPNDPNYVGIPGGEVTPPGAGAGVGMGPVSGIPEQYPGVQPGGGAGGGFEGQLPNPQHGRWRDNVLGSHFDPEAIRRGLLNRLQGQGPQPGTSAAALHHFLQQQQQQRQPVQKRRPILPPRRAVSQAY